MYLGKDMFDFTPLIKRILYGPLALIGIIFIILLGLYLFGTYPIYWVITGRNLDYRIRQTDYGFIDKWSRKYGELLTYLHG